MGVQRVGHVQRRFREMVGAYLICSVVAVGPACTNDSNPGTGSDTGVDAGSDAGVDAGQVPAAVVFALEVSNDAPESIYVQLKGENGDVGWITVRRGDDPINLLDRSTDCPIADEPRVRDITDGSFMGSIEFSWDGHEYPASTCSKTIAPAGPYTATFCFSLLADIPGGGPDPAGDSGAPGTVLNPSCSDVEFEHPTPRVVHAIIGG